MTREQLREDLIRYRCTTRKDAPEMLDHIDAELSWRLSEASCARRSYMLLPPGDLILERYKYNNKWKYELRRM